MSTDKLNNNKELVSKRINDILTDSSFNLSINYLLDIHKYLFDNILYLNGKYRDYNITKNEEILNNESIIYADYHSINSYLEYDFNLEKKYKYTNMRDIDILNLSKFTSNIWQTHPFTDGNTRSIGIFIEKYLISMGYSINNEFLKLNSKYYRNSLVLSSYYNYELFIHNNYQYLSYFYKLLLDNKLLLLDEIDMYKDINIKKIKRK